MYTAEQRGLDWYVCKNSQVIGSWYVGHMPCTEEQCKDAARRLNEGATIRDLPPYNKQNMNRIVAYCGEDTYTAMDAENGCVPSDATFIDLLSDGGYYGD